MSSHVFQNVLSTPYVYVGSDKTFASLRSANITRIIHFNASVPVVDVLSNGTFHMEVDYGKNEYDYLQILKSLCSEMAKTVRRRESVLLYVHTHFDECDNSRAYTLEEAWRIWSRAEKNKSGERRGKIVDHHREQLRVWTAMLDADWAQRHEIWSAWQVDMGKGERWRGRGLPTTEKLVQQVRRRI